MLFPESKRVIYQKNPLDQVICQLRFPSILRIDSDPASFQEKIRKDYPLLKERTENLIQLPQEMIEQVPSSVISSMFGVGSRAYDFVSEDESWVISLTRDFLALTANRYVRWEEFKQRLELCLDTLVDIYSPSFFSRIGLRYQNVIRRSKLNLDDTNWRELLKPYIVSELASPEPQVVKAIAGTYHNVLINLEGEHKQAKIVHGLVEDKNTKEACYLLDNDFFIQHNTEIDDVDKILTYFNRTNGHFFHWCITDRLHNAMEPSGEI